MELGGGGRGRDNTYLPIYPETGRVCLQSSLVRTTAWMMRQDCSLLLLLLLAAVGLTRGDDPGGHHAHHASLHGAPLRHGAYDHHADQHHDDLSAFRQPNSLADPIDEVFQVRSPTPPSPAVVVINMPPNGREAAAAAVAATALGEAGSQPIVIDLRGATNEKATSPSSTNEGARPSAVPPTVADLLALEPDFITLHSAVVAAGLTDVLAGPGPITLFAPTDTAFQKVPLEALLALQADKEALTALLLRHVVQGEDLEVAPFFIILIKMYHFINFF
jgi:hypothetical protein